MAEDPERVVAALTGCVRRSGTDVCVHGAGALVPLGTSSSIRTVFVILMENHDWSAIAGNPSAPFINTALLPKASYATRYSGVRHPSEPNYLWLEGGTDYGIADDADPAAHHVRNRDHLVSLLDQERHMLLPMATIRKGLPQPGKK